jgi:hypothetical protein
MGRGRAAGLPHYRAAGAKLNEAKSQMHHGEFTGWIKRNFSVSPKQVRVWMGLAAAEQNAPAGAFSSLSDFIRQTSDPVYNRPSACRPAGVVA